MDNDLNGFDEFSNMLEEYAKVCENVNEELLSMATEFVKDARKLPSPRSKIAKGGYTHLLDSITLRGKNQEIEVGWGKYYGPMVENGTRKMTGKQHLKPLWEKNKEKYLGKFKLKNNL